MKHRNGFTLVELLVVIGIISVLISMLLPALNKARQAANSIACQSNLRQIAMAYQMYMLTYHDWLVPSGGGWGQGITDANPRWDSRFVQMLGSSGPLNCPSAPQMGYSTPQISYAYTLVAWQISNPANPLTRRRVQDIREPWKQIMVWDGPPMEVTTSPSFFSPADMNQVRYRHNGGNEGSLSKGRINFFTLDFAIHSVTYSDLVTHAGLENGYRWYAWDND